MLKTYGAFDYLGDHDTTAEEVWNSIRPSHTDALTGIHTDEASFIVDVQAYQKGAEHFNDVTYLTVNRIGADRFTWREWGGTYDG